jgi:protein TonB
MESNQTQRGARSGGGYNHIQFCSVDAAASANNAGAMNANQRAQSEASMFDQLVESSPAKRGKSRFRYFGVTATVWIAVLALVVVGGVWSYDARLSDAAEFISLGPPQIPLTRGTPQPPQKRELNQQAQRQPSELVAQAKLPDRVSVPRTALPPIVEFVGDPGATMPGGPGSGGPAGSERGVEGGLEIPDRGRHVEPPQPEKKEPQPQTQTQPVIQVVRSGGVIQGTATRRVNPVYPPLARAARVSGVVVVEVVVDRTGAVTSARALQGHPLLREAAVAAATQWKWNPTLLTGVPVQVVGTITFNFTL